MTSSTANKRRTTESYERVIGSTQYAIQRLCELIEQTDIKPNVLTRLEQPLPNVSMLAWLETNNSQVKQFWSNRSKDFSISGIGSACTLQAANHEEIPHTFKQIKALIKGSNATFVGGVAFDEQSLSDHWLHRPYAEFVLPQIEISCKNGHYILAVNILPETFETVALLRVSLANKLKTLNFSRHHLNTDLTKYRITSRTHQPGEELWYESVSKALTDIKSKKLNKVVLSRQTELKLSAPVTGESLLSKWQQLDDNGYLFLLKFGQDSFVGNSPECLYKKAGRLLYTEALAGTVPRGHKHEEEMAHQQTLLNDPKIQSEHQLVVEYILSKIGYLAKISNRPPPLSIVKLSNIQHLCAKFSAKLNENISDEDIIRHLHPTPAVCGTPSKEAKQRINQFPGHSRGWYSGIVGTVSEHNSEFCVAIRSLLIKQNSLHCYAGAGLVSGSHAQSEWQELDSKIKTVLQLFD